MPQTRLASLVLFRHSRFELRRWRVVDAAKQRVKGIFPVKRHRGAVHLPTDLTTKAKSDVRGDTGMRSPTGVVVRRAEACHTRPHLRPPVRQKLETLQRLCEPRKYNQRDAMGGPMHVTHVACTWNYRMIRVSGLRLTPSKLVDDRPPINLGSPPTLRRPTALCPGSLSLSLSLLSLIHI